MTAVKLMNIRYLKMLARQYLVIQQLARCILEPLYKPSGEYRQT